MDDIAADWLRGKKLGSLLLVSAKEPRNNQFHRKFFALLWLAFDYFEPQVEWKGQPVAKEFDRFRRDVLVISGFGHPVVNLKGEVRYEADSISFAKCDEEKFNRIYNAVLDTLMKRVLSKAGFTRDEAERAVLEQEIANFA